MVLTRTKGDKGEPSTAPLSEAEIEHLQRKLNEKEERLRKEADLLREQRAEYEENAQALENLRIQMEKNGELQRQGAASEDIVVLKAELEELRREMARMRRPVSPTPRFSGQSLFTLGEPERTRESLSGNPPSELPKVSFREATDSVPSFDGYNVSLSQFIRACRRAKEIVPPSSERNLTKLLINKLRGRAYYAVEDEPCETVTQLTDLLTTAFGSAKTIDQYRGELSTVYQKPQEHMLDYICRVKDLRSSILDAERREIGSLSEDTISSIDQLTARSFCDGLPLQYRLQMSELLHTRPFEAFAKAKALAKREELDRDRYKTRDRREPERIINEYPRRQIPFAQRGISYESSRDGNRFNERHVNTLPRDTHAGQPLRERSAFERSAHNASPSNNAPIRRDDRSTKVCRYCKNPGHEIEECRKRQYNNSRQNQGNSTRPSRPADEPRAGPSQEITRPVRAIMPDANEQARESQC